MDAEIAQAADVAVAQGFDLGGRQGELAGEGVQVFDEAPAERGVAAHLEHHLVQRERAIDLVDVAHGR